MSDTVDTDTNKDSGIGDTSIQSENDNLKIDTNAKPVYTNIQPLDSPATTLLNKENDDAASASKIVPTDVRQLTIKNLDTGEEFIIGENDPDFEFDTFEIGGRPNRRKSAGGTTQDDDASTKQSSARRRWTLLNLFRRKVINKSNADDEGSENTSKTPFTKLSSFKFRKELGRGAFGRVLLAEAKTDGKLYALKIISKKNMRMSDKRQAKTERDILLAMNLKSPHPFTAGLRFAFQSENNLYLGMDFFSGGNLKELIKRFGSVPEDWARLYAAELTLAISHLHALNVIYRDIKPHNIMIDAHGHIVLIDFGLSKQDISHPRGALSLVGTPDYSAPEVLKTGVYQIEQSNKKKREAEAKANTRHGKSTIQRPPKDTTITDTEELFGKAKDEPTFNIPSNIGYGKAADWWSLGIMIYEMISGAPTFRGADLRQTYQKVLYSDVEFTPEEVFSPAAKSIILGLLKKDPTRRLGAWDTPPKDIMEHEFFKEISWDNVYQRQFDGPWVPDPVVFTKKSQITTQEAADDAKNVAESGSPETENEANESKASEDVNSNGIKPSTSSETLIKMSSTDTMKELGEEGRPSEMQIRDSIIAVPNTQPQANRIMEWSFFDENILMQAASTKPISPRIS